jgi:hypothetical protein
MASLPHGGVVAEIGVAEGDFSATILELNQPRELWLVDCWEHQSVEIIGHDPSNVPKEAQEARYQQVLQRFRDAPEVRVKRMYSVSAASTFADAYFDAIYLDANHLCVREDIDAWWHKIKPGGWLMGHDYTVAGDFCTVKIEVDRWVGETNNKLFVSLGGDDIYERHYPSWAVQKAR